MSFVRHGSPRLGTSRLGGHRTAATSMLAWPSTWVGVGGLEPPTSSLSGKRSNRLSYTPGLAPGSATDATCAGLGYRKPEFGVQSVSFSVTSMPPARWVTRL